MRFDVAHRPATPILGYVVSLIEMLLGVPWLFWIAGPTKVGYRRVYGIEKLIVSYSPATPMMSTLNLWFCMKICQYGLHEWNIKYE
jgi:hypothetical protein